MHAVMYSEMAPTSIQSRGEHDESYPPGLSAEKHPESSKINHYARKPMAHSSYFKGLQVRSNVMAAGLLFSKSSQILPNCLVQVRPKGVLKLRALGTFYRVNCRSNLELCMLFSLGTAGEREGFPCSAAGQWA